MAKPRELKGRYVSFLFLKINPEYYHIEREERVGVTKDHVGKLEDYTDQITHVLTSGFTGRYDQINLLEADDLESLYRMTEAFKAGAKSRYIDIVDAVVGIQLNNKADFDMIGSH